MPLGIVLPPMYLDEKINFDHVGQFASYFGIDKTATYYACRDLETLPYPQIVILQNEDSDGEISAACFVSSTTSRSYRRLASPNGRIHRDFHYQCFFTALNLLIEVGCTHIRLKSLRPDEKWLQDSYVCFMEARRNLIARWQKDIRFEIELFDGDRERLGFISENIEEFQLNFHRAIYSNLEITHGLNVTTIYPDIRPNRRKYHPTESKFAFG